MKRHLEDQDTHERCESQEVEEEARDSTDPSATPRYDDISSNFGGVEMSQDDGTASTRQRHELHGVVWHEWRQCVDQYLRAVRKARPARVFAQCTLSFPMLADSEIDRSVIIAGAQARVAAGRVRAKPGSFRTESGLLDTHDAAPGGVERFDSPRADRQGEASMDTTVCHGMTMPKWSRYGDVVRRSRVPAAERADRWG